MREFSTGYAQIFVRRSIIYLDRIAEVCEYLLMLKPSKRTLELKKAAKPEQWNTCPQGHRWQGSECLLCQKQRELEIRRGREN